MFGIWIYLLKCDQNTAANKKNPHTPKTSNNQQISKNNCLFTGGVRDGQQSGVWLYTKHLREHLQQPMRWLYSNADPFKLLYNI